MNKSPSRISTYQNNDVHQDTDDMEEKDDNYDEYELVNEDSSDNDEPIGPQKHVK